MRWFTQAAAANKATARLVPVTTQPTRSGSAGEPAAAKASEAGRRSSAAHASASSATARSGAGAPAGTGRLPPLAARIGRPLQRLAASFTPALKRTTGADSRTRYSPEGIDIATDGVSDAVKDKAKDQAKDRADPGWHPPTASGFAAVGKRLRRSLSPRRASSEEFGYYYRPGNGNLPTQNPTTGFGYNPGPAAPGGPHIAWVSNPPQPRQAGCDPTPTQSKARSESQLRPQVQAEPTAQARPQPQSQPQSQSQPRPKSQAQAKSPPQATARPLHADRPKQFVRPKSAAQARPEDQPSNLRRSASDPEQFRRSTQHYDYRPCPESFQSEPVWDPSYPTYRRYLNPRSYPDNSVNPGYSRPVRDGDRQAGAMPPRRPPMRAAEATRPGHGFFTSADMPGPAAWETKADRMPSGRVPEQASENVPGYGFFTSRGGHRAAAQGMPAQDAAPPAATAAAPGTAAPEPIRVQPRTVNMDRLRSPGRWRAIVAQWQGAGMSDAQVHEWIADYTKTFREGDSRALANAFKKKYAHLMTGTESLGYGSYKALNMAMRQALRHTT